MDVSENNGTPKSSILIIVFHYKPSIFGTPIYGNTHISRNFLSLATQMTDSEKESDNEKESSFCCQGFYCSIPLPDGLEKLAFDWKMSHDVIPLSCVLYPMICP